VAIDAKIVEAAEELGINVGRVCELSLKNQIGSARAEAQRTIDPETVASSNRYVEKYGLPLERYRLF